MIIQKNIYTGLCVRWCLFDTCYTEKKKKIVWIKQKFVVSPKSTAFIWFIRQEWFSFVSTQTKTERNENYFFQTIAACGWRIKLSFDSNIFFFSVLIISIFSANEKRKRNRNRTTSWQNCVMGNGNGKFPHYRNRNRKSGWRNCSYSCWGIPIWEFLIHFFHHTVLSSCHSVLIFPFQSCSYHHKQLCNDEWKSHIHITASQYTKDCIDRLTGERVYR